MTVLRFPTTSAISGGEVTLGRDDEDHTVVWLRGEHDIATVTVLSESMARAITLDDGDVFVDLSGVEFMGVATVDVLLRTRDRLELAARSLGLRSPSIRAKRVLDLYGLAYAS